jgi:hypothetical protein
MPLSYMQFKQINMKDLVDFKNAQITALQDSNAQKEARIAILETWIFELTDDKCPRDYKQVIRTELLKTN